MQDAIESACKFMKSFKDDNNIRLYFEKIQEMMERNEYSMTIKFYDVKKYDPEMAKMMITYPDDMFSAMDDGLKVTVEELDEEYAKKFDDFFVRVVGLDEIVRLRHIRAKNLGQLIAIEGIVTRATMVKSGLYVGVYECGRCGNQIVMLQDDFHQVKPSECPLEECNNKKSFKFLKEQSKYRDWQKIRIQEMPSEVPARQIPRYVDAILKFDLVDRVKPGDHVVITGVMRNVQDRGHSGKLVTFTNYMDVRGVEKFEQDIEELELTIEEEEEIITFSKQKDAFRLLINNIAPNIHGHDTIKKALLLSLFGGVTKEKVGNTLRGNIHVLLIGDPGTGKSQMLKFISSISPRGVYTTGKGNTAAGLTATVVYDKTTGEPMLEAGALVIGDLGLVCIDELTQMRDVDASAIHEAMEQQSISVHKAGINATLNARTTIIASANPTYGRYDTMRSITENLKKITPTLLSRFDLIFILRDIPNQKDDEEKTMHVLKQHEEETGLSISPEYMMKYIHYAKLHYRPKLSKEASDTIKKFYLDMRNKSALLDGNDTPVTITYRFLEGIIRLAEARARVELRDTITKKDALEVIEILRESLMQVGVDKETGEIDIDIVELGRPKSKMNKIHDLIDLIKTLENQKGCTGITLEEIIEQAEKTLNMNDKIEVERLLETAVINSLIYKPRTNLYASLE